MLAAARTQWERAKAFVPSDEQIRQRIAEREKQAGEHGHVPKTQKQIDLVRRKWLRFLDAHGEAYGYDKDAGPTLAIVKHFTTCCYETRDYESSLEHKGMGDSFELQLRYFLAKKVFPAVGYDGWTELSVSALDEKCEPYKTEIREHWKRMKNSDEDQSSSEHGFVKQKWCDSMYFLAMDQDMTHTKDSQDACVVAARAARDGAADVLTVRRVFEGLV